MNVLITGGAGFIGSHLAESLCKRDGRQFKTEKMGRCLKHENRKRI